MSINILDIGGGFPVKYLADVLSIEAIGKSLSQFLNSWRKTIGEFDLIAEPGRFLVADAGILVTRVINIKNREHAKIAIVDANYNELPDVLIGQHYPMRVLGKSNNEEVYRIAGNLCDGGDWLEPDPTLLPKLTEGDLIIFDNVGAYASTFKMSFCDMDLPPILFVDGDKCSIARERVKSIE